MPDFTPKLSGPHRRLPSESHFWRWVGFGFVIAVGVALFVLIVKRT